MRGQRAAVALSAVGALLLLAPFAAASPHGDLDPLPAGAFASARLPLALDAQNATALSPNQSVSGTLPAGDSRLFKVAANRTGPPGDVLTVTLEASGGSFPVGGASIYGPEQVLLDEVFTWNIGQLNVSNIIVPQTGEYLIVVYSSQVFVWSLTVNLTGAAATPDDNDNDHANATALGPTGTLTSSVADWSDLFDTYGFALGTRGAFGDALVVNLSSPGVADLDLYLYHLEGGLAVLDSYSLSPFGTEFVAFLADANRTEYLRVLSYSGTSAYTLTWDTFNVSGDDNGAPQRATPLGSAALANNLSRWDVRDFYRLELAARTTVNISVHTEGFNASSRLPDIGLILWNESFSRVSWSYSFDPDERINVVVPEGGTYYLDLFASDTLFFLTTQLTFNYTMSVRVDPPPALLSPAWNASFEEDTPASFDLLSAVARDPSNETLTFRVLSVTGGLVAALGADGHTLTVSAPLDWWGPAVVRVEAADQFATAAFDLPVTVTPVNDAPRARVAGLSFAEDGLGALLLNESVADPEGDAVVLVSFDAEPPLVPTVLAGGLQLLAPADWNGAVRLNVTVEDAGGARLNLTFLVTVTPVNDAPAFVGPVGPFVIDEDAGAQGATFSLAGLAQDADGDELAFTLSAPVGLSGLAAGTTLVLVPAADVNGDFPCLLTVTDGSASAAQAVTVRVRPVDDPPALVPPREQLVGREGAAFAFTASAVDIDTPSAALRYSFWMDGTREVDNATSAGLSWTFTFEDEGFHVLRVAVFDGNGSDGFEASVFVTATNRPPVASILSPRGGTVGPGATVTFSGRGQDPDGTEVNLTWIVDGRVASTSATFSLDGLGAGAHSVVLLASDGEFSAKDETAFTVAGAFGGAGDALTLAALAALGALAGGALLLVVRARRRG